MAEANREYVRGIVNAPRPWPEEPERGCDPEEANILYAYRLGQESRHEEVEYNKRVCNAQRERIAELEGRFDVQQAALESKAAYIKELEGELREIKALDDSKAKIEQLEAALKSAVDARAREREGFTRID